MKRLKLILAALLICSFLFATQVVVIYQLEIVQLSDETINKFDLKELHVDKPDLSAYEFRILYDPSVMELLVKIPFVTATFEVGTKQEKTKMYSRPWVSTLLGKPAVLFAGVSELSLKTGTTTGAGLRIELTPVNITEGKVDTKILISDPYNPTLLDNELWIGSEFSPICLAAVKTPNDMKYFAVYVKSSFLNEPPKENIVFVGGMDEFANLFNFSSVDHESEVYGFIRTDFSQFSGEVGTSIWIIDSLVLQSKVVIVPFSMMAGIENAVGKEGLRAGVRFVYDNGFYIALGISDYSQVSNVLTLFAEFYPFKLSLTDLKFVEPLWKVGAQIDFESFSITLGAYNSSDINIWLDGRVKITNGIFIIIGSEYSLNGKIYLIAGFNIRF